MDSTTRQRTRKTSTVPKPLPFVYEPLDYAGGSIRLLRFLPQLSETGLLQCQIWHASLKSKYTCLSYVWGPVGHEQDILINGKIAKVRKNLKDFMEIARKKYAASSRAFWIDAVCIDQGNAPERTYQVAQMSNIYTGAEEVVGWLGYSGRIERAFAFWRELNTRNPQTFHETHKIWHNHINNQNKELRKDWNELAEQGYWTRAWITQEILLARKLKLLVNDTEIEPRPTPGIAQLLPDRSSSRGKLDLISTQVFHTYLEHLSGSTNIMGINLISLLRFLSTREATQSRDLIISLLSVVQDTESITTACSKSNKEMLLDLLEMFTESLCPCTTSYLASALELKVGPGLFAKSRRDIQLFAIPMKVADTLPTFRFELDDQIRSCTHCQSEIADLGLEWIALCMDRFSGCTRGTHLYLSKHHIAHGKTKHVIIGGANQEHLEVQFVEETEHDNDCVISPQRMCGEYTLYFTADVLMRLFCQYPQFTQVSLFSQAGDAKKHICTGPVVSRHSGKLQRVSKPDTSCSLTGCQERRPSRNAQITSQLPGPPVSRHNPRSQVQQGTWSAASTVERFFGDPAPWVPGQVRDPLPQAAFSKLGH
jgi:hypothetical protein